ncbi:MAG: hypothetical protein AAF989_00140, partial [Planctomycetota bacterium]
GPFPVFDVSVATLFEIVPDPTLFHDVFNGNRDAHKLHFSSETLTNWQGSLDRQDPVTNTVLVAGDFAELNSLNETLTRTVSKRTEEPTATYEVVLGPQTSEAATSYRRETSSGYVRDDFRVVASGAVNFGDANCLLSNGNNCQPSPVSNHKDVNAADTSQSLVIDQEEAWMEDIFLVRIQNDRPIEELYSNGALWSKSRDYLYQRGVYNAESEHDQTIIQEDNGVRRIYTEEFFKNSDPTPGMIARDGITLPAAVRMETQRTSNYVSVINPNGSLLRRHGVIYDSGDAFVLSNVFMDGSYHMKQGAFVGDPTEFTPSTINREQLDLWQEWSKDYYDTDYDRTTTFSNGSDEVQYAVEESGQGDGYWNRDFDSQYRYVGEDDGTLPTQWNASRLEVIRGGGEWGGPVLPGTVDAAETLHGSGATLYLPPDQHPVNNYLAADADRGDDWDYWYAADFIETHDAVSVDPDVFRSGDVIDRVGSIKTRALSSVAEMGLLPEVLDDGYAQYGFVDTWRYEEFHGTAENGDWARDRKSAGYAENHGQHTIDIDTEPNPNDSPTTGIAPTFTQRYSNQVLFSPGTVEFFSEEQGQIGGGLEPEFGILPDILPDNDIHSVAFMKDSVVQNGEVRMFQKGESMNEMTYDDYWSEQLTATATPVGNALNAGPTTGTREFQTHATSSQDAIWEDLDEIQTLEADGTAVNDVFIEYSLEQNDSSQQLVTIKVDGLIPDDDVFEFPTTRNIWVAVSTIIQKDGSQPPTVDILVDEDEQYGYSLATVETIGPRSGRQRVFAWKFDVFGCEM